jgi:hypothetical protein
MFSRLVVMAGEHHAAKPAANFTSAGFGPIILVVALSPLCAVCGLMLSQIFGFAPY